MRAVKQLLIGPRLILFDLKKYRIALFISLLLVPVSLAIEYNFRGSFVGVVDYLGLDLSYTLFIALGVAISSIVNNIVYNTEGLLRHAKELIIKAVHPLIVPVTASIRSFILDIIFMAVFSVVLWLISGIPTTTLLLSLAVAYVFGLPIFLSIGVLLATLAFVVRGRDYRRLRRFLDVSIRLAIPVFYGVEVYPEWIQPYILYFPTVSIIEGTRRLVLGIGGMDLLLYSLASGLVVLALSMKLFTVVFNWARRTGKVVLE